MFKRLKQNFPLKYFLGDNQNAIEIQIWVSLICQLILLIVQRTAEKRWAFSNMASVIRYHLMTYINLFKFLKSPKANYVDLTTKNLSQDRKSTRLNSSHVRISYAVFCLKK